MSVQANAKGCKTDGKKNDRKTFYISAYVGRRLENVILVQNVFLIFINRIIFIRREPMFTEMLVYTVGP